MDGLVSEDVASLGDIRGSDATDLALCTSFSDHPPWSTIKFIEFREPYRVLAGPKSASGLMTTLRTFAH
jgi:hypothetical protein